MCHTGWVPAMSAPSLSEHLALVAGLVVSAEALACELAVLNSYHEAT